MAYSRCHSGSKSLTLLTHHVTYNQISCLALWTWNVQLTVRCIHVPSYESDKNPSIKTNLKTNVQWNLSQVKWLFSDTRLFHLREQVRCKHRMLSYNLMLLFLSLESQNTNPHQTTHQWLHGCFWCTTHAQYAAENKGEIESHKTGLNVIFFPFLWCGSYHMVLGLSTGLFTWHLFLFFSFFFFEIVDSLRTKQAL